MPVESVREDAAEKDADRAAAGGDEPEDPHRLRPLGGLGEERHHQRERNCRDDRATDALHSPGGDEHLLRPREAADSGGCGEESDPGEKQPPVPKEVAEPTAEQKEPAESEQVGVHDPRERLLREAEIHPGRRQRDPDDRHVEDDHEFTQAEDQEREPAPVADTVSALGPEPRVLSFTVCVYIHRSLSWLYFADLRRERGDQVRVEFREFS